MNEDLITNSFTDNVSKAVVKRNLALSRIALVLSIVYSLTVLLDWYSLLKSSSLNGEASITFYYRVMLIIDIILLAIDTYGFILIIKAYRFINNSLEKSDPGLMTMGFKYFYTSNILLIISFVIAILSGLLKQHL
jgi:hypothetical protein